MMVERRMREVKGKKRDRASWHSARFGYETVDDVPSKDGRKKAPDMFSGRERASAASLNRMAPRWRSKNSHDRCGTKLGKPWKVDRKDEQGK